MTVAKEFSVRRKTGNQSLKLFSSSGHLRISSKMTCPIITFHSPGNVIISSTVHSKSLTTRSLNCNGQTLVEGRLFGIDGHRIDLHFETDVHTSVDSNIGSCDNFRQTIEKVSISVEGNLSHFGSIKAKTKIFLSLKGHFCSPKRLWFTFEAK
jgi:hypothetical protein